MPKKITVKFEVTHHVCVDVEVDEETFLELENTYDLKALNQHGITYEGLLQKCMSEGHYTFDYAVVDNQLETVIPWDGGRNGHLVSR